MPVSIQSRNC